MTPPPPKILLSFLAFSIVAIMLALPDTFMIPVFYFSEDYPLAASIGYGVALFITGLAFTSSYVKWEETKEK